MLDLQVDANGVNTTHLYDAAGRPTVVTHMKAAGAVLERITYAYDDVGNRTSAAAHDGSVTTFAYDNAYRLIDEWRTGPNAYRTSHTYDPVGNRTVEETDGSKTTFTYDAANQLKTREPEDVHDPTTSYSYDQAGNLEKEQVGTSVTTYTWDDENRMSGILFPASGKATLVYNADGLRVKKEDSGGTVKSIWDFQNVLAETDNANSTQTVYTLAPRLYGNLLSQRRGSTSHFHLFDALGSTIGLTNATQTLSDSYLYKAYGETLASSGSTANPFKWVGQVGYYDDASPVNLHYVRARYYNDALARWMSEDPLGVVFGPNRYAYGDGRPTLLSDPSGLNPIAFGCAGGAAGSLITSGIDYLFNDLSGCKFLGDLICDTLTGCLHGLLATFPKPPGGSSDCLGAGLFIGLINDACKSIVDDVCGCEPIDPKCTIANALISALAGLADCKLGNSKAEDWIFLILGIDISLGASLGCKITTQFD